MSNTLEQFRQAIEATGLQAPDVIYDDGAIHRFSTNGKPTQKNGWYFLHKDGTPWGQAGSWDVNSGDPICHWCAKIDSAMTDAERDAHRQRIAAMKALRETEVAEKHEAAALDAARRFKGATPCTRRLPDRQRCSRPWREGRV